MKTISLLALCFLVSTGLYAQEKALKPQAQKTMELKASKSQNQMVFEATTLDYGTIAQNSDGKRVFKFVNNSDKPLVIARAKGSCGCTVPSYPKKPVMPGESGEIEVTYDTKRLGKFKKSVTLTTNISKEDTVLYIEGNVVAEEKKNVGAKTLTNESIIRN
ncbi:MAG: DUF1573 domain-containing protein [Flavobacteriaceae bacterium]|nr:DUF1573 domain-containing protein [Flavobacteriaceae bacterium]